MLGACARAGLSGSGPGTRSCHEPLGGQVPAVLPRAAGLPQGAGGAAAQSGESGARGAVRGRLGKKQPAKRDRSVRAGPVPADAERLPENRFLGQP